MPESGPPAIPSEHRIPFRPGLTLMSAINKSGGFTSFERVKAIRLHREGKIIKFDIRKLNPDGSNNPLLQNGDVIVFP